MELDCAAPILYKGENKNLKKAYIILITCSLSRAMQLELVQSQKLEEFIIFFKRSIAQRGRPQKVYSNNAKTFKAVADWIKVNTKSERFQDYLSESYIKWQFNLS